jgi:hypothetical protein
MLTHGHCRNAERARESVRRHRTFPLDMFEDGRAASPRRLSALRIAHPDVF